MEKGFTFPLSVGHGLQDVFVKSPRKRVTTKFVEEIIRSRPDIFRIEGGANMEAWTSYISRRIRPAVMTMRWFDSLNRMDIEISGEGFCGRGGWEDENRVLILEV